ncbi:hypothetical protein FC62_GL000792 [Amylolactobacillus amylotrophicus DSM 20534]|nr:hypothetical protein FC62_GL000792 [Amylolactobacillus amylotrophicus DSM 20534]KRM42283.1 hypothetical protein FD40_GL001069 [Amylolactobacillus amylophilus DSM 20533 = JCM 1125]
MAVGVLIGGALSTLVKSLTSNLLNPLISIFLGSIDLSAIKFRIGSALFTVGNFLNDVISFIIIAFIVFLIVKFFNHFRKEKKDAGSISPTEQYLKEIRDLLQQSKTDTPEK